MRAKRQNPTSPQPQPSIAGDIDALTQRIDELSRIVREASGSVVAVQGELARATRDRKASERALASDLSQAQDAIADLRKRGTAAQGQAASAARPKPERATDHAHELSVLADRVSTLSGMVKENAGQSAAREGTINELRSSVTGERARIDAAIGELREEIAKIAKRGAAPAAKQVVQFDERLTNKLTALDDRLNNLANTVREAAGTAVATNGQLTKTGERLGELERTLRTKSDETRSSLEKLERELSALREQVRKAPTADKHAARLEESIRTISDRMNTVSMMVRDSSSRLTARDNAAADLDARLTALAEHVTGLAADVRVEREVVAAQPEITSLDTTAFETRITELGDTMGRLAARVEQLDVATDSVDNALAAALGQRVDALESSAATAREAIAALGADQESLASAQQTLAADLASVEEQGVATQTKLDEVAASVDAVGQSVGAVEQTIGTVTEKVAAVEQTVGAVDAKIASVEQTVGAVDAKVASFDTKIAAIDGKVAAVETAASTVDEKVAAVQTIAAGVEEKVATVTEQASAAATESAAAAAAAQAASAKVDAVDERIAAVEQVAATSSEAHTKIAEITDGQAKLVSEQQALSTGHDALRHGQQALAKGHEALTQSHNDLRTSLAARVTELKETHADLARELETVSAVAHEALAGGQGEEAGPMLRDLAAKLEQIETDRQVVSRHLADADAAWQAERETIRTQLAALSTTAAPGANPETDALVAELTTRLERLERDHDSVADIAAMADGWTKSLGVLAARVDYGLIKLQQASEAPTGTSDARELVELASRVASMETDRDSVLGELRRATEAWSDERAALHERVAELSARIVTGPVDGTQAQQAVAGDLGEASVELDRLRIGLEGMRMRLAYHEKTVAEMGGTGLGERLDELSVRLDRLQAAINSGVAGVPGGPALGFDMDGLMRRLEKAEQAAQSQRSDMLGHLEKVAARMDWRLQRLESPVDSDVDSNIIA